MSDVDSMINDKVCRFYPGDPNNCIKDLPIVKIKIVLSIIFIIMGILIIRKQSSFIEKQIINLFKKFGKLIGFTFIVIGVILLNNSVNGVVR
jgi:hypothetical protein